MIRLLLLLLLPVLSLSGPTHDSGKLLPPTFQPLPLGQLQTRGWLRRQMDLAARGLAGSEHLIWPWLANSQFLGRCSTNATTHNLNNSMCEGWQFSTYAMNGLVGTGFLASEEASRSLRNFTDHWMAYQWHHQEEDGWVGPGSTTNPIVNQQFQWQNYDTYPSLMHLMAMAQYVDATNDTAVLRMMTKLVHKLSDVYREPQCVRPAGRQTWPVCGGGKCDGGVCKCCVTSRYPELTWAVNWLFDRTSDPFMLDFLDQIHSSIATELGTTWIDFFEHFNCTEAYTPAQCGEQHLMHHGVDVAEGIKYGALRWRRTGNRSDLESSILAVAKLWQYHGQANGVMSNDENLGGLLPSHGTETCSIVESLFSLETTAMITGSVVAADAAERVAYNAMPGFSTPNQWGHVYFQYSNQPRSGPSATETHYKSWKGTIPCCTANHPQGWSKWAQHLLAKTTRNGIEGLAVVHYAPVAANTSLRVKGGGNNGADMEMPVSIEVSTDYPWKEQVNISIESANSTQRFPLCVRIPGWCLSARLRRLGGSRSGAVEALPSAPLANGTYTCVTVGGGAQLSLTLPMGVSGRIERRVNNAAVILRGPLVFSLPVPGAWVGGKAPSMAVAVADGDEGFNFALSNTSRWAYALNLSSLRFIERGSEVPAVPWAAESAAVEAMVEGRWLPQWESFETANRAGIDAPCGPVGFPLDGGAGDITAAETETLTLVPYGSTQLRISEWPTIQGTAQPPGTRRPCVDRPCDLFNYSLPPHATKGTNRPNNDIWTGGKPLVADEPMLCYEACRTHGPSCQAWVFVRKGCNAFKGYRPWCWLKSAPGTARGQEGYISGVMDH